MRLAVYVIWDTAPKNERRKSVTVSLFLGLGFVGAILRCAAVLNVAGQASQHVSGKLYGPYLSFSFTFATVIV